MSTTLNILSNSSLVLPNVEKASRNSCMVIAPELDVFMRLKVALMYLISSMDELYAIIINAILLKSQVVSLYFTSPSNICLTVVLFGSKYPVGNSFFNHGNRSACSIEGMK